MMMIAILQTTGTVPCDKLREAIPATDRLVDPDSVAFDPSGVFLNIPGAGEGYKAGLENAGGYPTRPTTENCKQSENFAYFYGQTRVNSNITGITGILYTTNLTTKY